MLFATPYLDLEDAEALQQLDDLRGGLADALRTPRRWQGGLHRSMVARHIRGSNTIEGYDVEVDDAAAALDDQAPLSAEEPTFAQIRGYRDALGYVLATAGDPHLRLDPSTLRSLHYMMLGHDRSTSPGRYRTGPGPVVDRHAQTVYTGPSAPEVPGLVEELMTRLEERRTRTKPVVLAAMAHLNLVMIHPFQDGNGRLARALQTLVLSRSGPVEPAFSSIEEWLGHNVEDYDRVLARTGGASWQPAGDAQLWLKFCIRAHHIQAQTTARRLEDAAAIYPALDRLLDETGLPVRVLDELYDACLGFRIRRSSYAKRAGIEQRTATRDLARLADLGLLTRRGAASGRHYVAGPRLFDLGQAAVGPRSPITDPYPAYRAELLGAGPASAKQAQGR